LNTAFIRKAVCTHAQEEFASHKNVERAFGGCSMYQSRRLRQRPSAGTRHSTKKASSAAVHTQSKEMKKE
jgi:hypothetical protein